MDSSDDNTKQLNQLLSLLSKKATALLSVMSQEQTALSSSAPEKLEPVLLEKNQLTQSLEQLEKQRLTLMQSLGINNDQLKTQKIWQDFLTIIAECQKKNEENGAIIELQNKQNQQLINVLHGFSGKNQTYNKSGNRTQNHGGRIIGSA